MPAISDPIGLAAIDDVLAKVRPTVDDFAIAASAYIRSHEHLGDSLKKKAQLRLSYILARVFVHDFGARVPTSNLFAGETKVGGGLRTVNADVVEYHGLDGLRVAVEIKPINLAVGRAIWNRFGDIRTFAVNIHLKFPFAVVGGVLTIPTTEAHYFTDAGDLATSKTTKHLINRAVERFRRSGSRETEGDATHLLESIALIAFDPITNAIDPDLPPPGSGLRWDEFVEQMAKAYEGRFEL